MRPRAALRYEEWSLEPDLEPDAEVTTYAMQCVVDEESSLGSEDYVEPQEWVLEHLDKNPSHLTYREIITRPWRAWRRG